MSVAQPGPATTPAVTLPRFPITLWGYERRYVDSFVTGLVEQLERERQRSDQAERGLRQLQQDIEQGRAQVPAWFSSVGEEIDQVLDNAGRAAAKLLAEAGRRIQAATDAADVQAAEREQLATLRQSMVEQLVQVYAPLGLTLVDARGEIQAPAQDGQRTGPQEPNPAAVTADGRHARQPDLLAKPDDEVS